MNTETKKSIKWIIDQYWNDEMKHFVETYECHIQSQDTIEAWIEACEKNGWTDHTFYHLMVLSKNILK